MSTKEDWEPIYTLEWVKEAILRTKGDYFSFNNWRCFWEETSAWICAESKKDNDALNFHIDGLQNISGHDMGLIVDYFHEYMETVYGVKPAWRLAETAKGAEKTTEGARSP